MFGNLLTSIWFLSSMSRKTKKAPKSIPLKDSRYILSKSDGRIRTSKGHFVKKDVAVRLTHLYYTEGKDGRLRRPNGTLAKTYEKNLYKEFKDKPRGGSVVPPESSLKGVLEGRFRADHKEVTSSDAFARGRFLKRQFYFNFFCACRLKDESESPETYIEDLGGERHRIVEHWFGYATNQFTTMGGLYETALSAHDRHYPQHINEVFKLTEKKTMQL